MNANDAKAIDLGHPSYVWRFGQERRLTLIRRYAPLEGRRILDVGCGLGMYVHAFRRFSDDVFGVDIDVERVVEAGHELPNLSVGAAEALPFADDSFDVVLSHEVLEHVTDDGVAMRETLRVLRPGGRAVIFVPNRLYPLETHGFFWRGQYHFGNIPLINYLPDSVRRRFAPHVRAYTAKGLRRLLDGLPHRVIVHTQVYPGYDKIVARLPRFGGFLRAVTYGLERTPLRALGLSHLVVVEKVSRAG